MDASEIFQKARLKVIAGNKAFPFRATTPEDVGIGWAWRILYNAEEHLKDSPSIPVRSDLGLWFSDTMAGGRNCS